MTRARVTSVLAALAILILALAPQHQPQQEGTWQADAKQQSPSGARYVVSSTNSAPISNDDRRPPVKIHAPVQAAHPASIGPARTPSSSPTSSGAAASAPSSRYSGSVPDLIRSVFPSSQWTMALCIANRESGFYPGAKNPTSSASGVFQLVALWWNGYWHFDPFDAYANVYHAWLLWKMSGWGPWGGGC